MISTNHTFETDTEGILNAWNKLRSRTKQELPSGTDAKIRKDYSRSNFALSTSVRMLVLFQWCPAIMQTWCMQRAHYQEGRVFRIWTVVQPSWELDMKNFLPLVGKCRHYFICSFGTLTHASWKMQHWEERSCSLGYLTAWERKYAFCNTDMFVC